MITPKIKQCEREARADILPYNNLKTVQFCLLFILELLLKIGDNLPLKNKCEREARAEKNHPKMTYNFFVIPSENDNPQNESMRARSASRNFAIDLIA